MPRSDCRGDRNELHAGDHRARPGGGGGRGDGGSHRDALLQQAQSGGALPAFSRDRQRGRHSSHPGKRPVEDLRDIRPETLARLASIPNIVGVEDVACDLSRFSVHSLSSAPNFIRWSRDDSASLLFRMAGGTCSVSIVANVVPRLWADMQRACEAGDCERRQVNSARLKPLVAALQQEPAPVKYALSLAHPWFSATMKLARACKSADGPRDQFGFEGAEDHD